MDDLVDLGISAPPFFVEACGYRGRSRFVALRWFETTDELWLTDDGHAMRADASPLSVLWRRDGGRAALVRLRIEEAERGRTPWLLVDRECHSVHLGCAVSVWHVIQTQQRRRN